MLQTNDLDDTKEVESRYQSYVDGIITTRVRIISIVAIVMYLSLNLLDWIAYPAYAVFFLKIRALCSVTFFLIFLLTFLKQLNRIMVWFSDFIGLSTGLGVVLMIFSSNGSSSHYYEGLNVIYLGIGIMNSFYSRHNVVLFLTIIGAYNLAVFTNDTPFDKVTVGIADSFMVCTSFMVVLMNRFYSTQHRQAFMRQEQLDQLSKTDELTHVHNRRYFFERLQYKIETSERLLSSFYLIIFDVDHFKDINDRWGHSFGDLALTKVIEVVTRNIRANDCLGRFGGDEFILFLDTANADVLMQRLTKISQAVTSLNLKQQNQTVLISVSIGAAKFVPQQSMTKELLLEKADQQLLLVKKTNRGQIGVAE